MHVSCKLARFDVKCIEIACDPAGMTGQSCQFEDCIALMQSRTSMSNVASTRRSKRPTLKIAPTSLTLIKDIQLERKNAQLEDQKAELALIRDQLQFEN